MVPIIRTMATKATETHQREEDIIQKEHLSEVIILKMNMARKMSKNMGERLSRNIQSTQQTSIMMRIHHTSTSKVVKAEASMVNKTIKRVLQDMAEEGASNRLNSLQEEEEEVGEEVEVKTQDLLTNQRSQGLVSSLTL